jgi:hypothetical protein
MEMKELLVLNSEGLIPGPGESEENFCQRVQAVKNCFHTQGAALAPHHWQWASEQLQALYDFAPRWCTAIYSSKGLAPWQAAATWIDVKRVYTIQIRPSRWLSWLVDTDEVLAHEAVHAARAAFNEPKSEEMLAYLTSSAKWRQVIGPLFRQPKEAFLLMLLIGFGAVLQVMEAVWDHSFGSSGCFFTAAVLSFGLGARLFWMRTRFNRAARQLAPRLRDSSKVRAVLFRLTDEEIIQLASGKSVGEKKDLRWRVIEAAYFKDLA